MTVHIYTDGSCIGDTSYSGSMVAIDPKVNRVVHYDFTKGANKDYISQRNISGEIMGVYLAIHWAIPRGEMDIVIYHDYIGLQKWADHEWKARTGLSKSYVKTIDSLRAQGATISFRKVKAHSNVPFNELADILAKRALDLASEKELQLALKQLL